MSNFNYQKFIETRAKSGYDTVFLVKKPTETKFSMFLPMETTPAIEGSTDSFEFDILQSNVKGKVKGKSTLDDKEVEFLNTPDNIYRLEQLKDQTLDFLQYYSVGNGSAGYGFRGTCEISYRLNDATADVNKGTITVTPMTFIDKPIMDCRNIIQLPLFFTSAMPEALNDILSTGQTVTVTSDVTDFKIDVSIFNTSGEKDTTNFEATVTDPEIGKNSGTVKFSRKAEGTDTLYGHAYITISKENYSSWTWVIYLESHRTTAE